MKTSVQHPWILSGDQKTQARLRLFCFPHSGGGASFYRHWNDVFGDEIDVCPVQLPGRENRRNEPSFTRFDTLIEVLADALTPYMDRPFAFFGHSLGALISFGLARQLRSLGKSEPVHLFVSGRRAPHIPRQDESVATLSNEAFIEKIRRFHGTDEAILQNSELMELFLPLLRADFSIYESFVYTPAPAFTYPISALGGRDDSEVSMASLIAWKKHTSSTFGLHQFPGGHFFLLGKEKQLAHIVHHEMSAFFEAGAWMEGR